MKTKGLGLALAILAFGAPGLAKPAAEKPGSAAKRVTKKLAKLKSYEVRFQVTGGTAIGADHKPVQTRVNHTWTEKVRGKVEAINGEKVFRLRRGGEDGAIQQGAKWKALLATEEGRMISRLFQRPEAHLMNALKHRKRARWIAPSGAKGPKGSAKQALPADTPEAKPAETGAQTKTKTKAAGPSSKSEAGSESEPLSHVIVIEAPAVEAVREFNRIVTSGCFSEG